MKALLRSRCTNGELLYEQASLGGRLRMIITGAAPTSPAVLGFLRAALGCQVRHTDTYPHTLRQLSHTLAGSGRPLTLNTGFINSSSAGLCCLAMPLSNYAVLFSKVQPIVTGLNHHCVSLTTLPCFQQCLHSFAGVRGVWADGMHSRLHIHHARRLDIR